MGPSLSSYYDLHSIGEVCDTVYIGSPFPRFVEKRMYCSQKCAWQSSLMAVSGMYALSMPVGPREMPHSGGPNSRQMSSEIGTLTSGYRHKAGYRFACGSTKIRKQRLHGLRVWFGHDSRNSTPHKSLGQTTESVH